MYQPAAPLSARTRSPRPIIRFEPAFLAGAAATVSVISAGGFIELATALIFVLSLAAHEASAQQRVKATGGCVYSMASMRKRNPWLRLSGLRLSFPSDESGP